MPNSTLMENRRLNAMAMATKGHILNLPTELRTSIFEYFYDESAVCYLGNLSETIGIINDALDKGVNETVLKDRADETSSTNVHRFLPPLKACRTFYKESAPLLYNNVCFSVWVLEDSIGINYLQMRRRTAANIVHL